MGKRVEKAMKEKLAASSTSQDAEDDANKTPEPYTCTGNFEADFTELCRRGGIHSSEIPPVVLRPKRPGTPPPPDPKAKEPVADDGEQDEEDAKPKTYVTKEKFDYFKPCVQVAMEKEDKPETVTEVFIRGWKIDDLMVGVFKQCFPTMEKLHSIHFWNTALTETTLKELASFLPQCANVKNVAIENTPIPEEPWSALIGEDSLLVNLSLRHNNITDKGASAIGKALSTEKTCNKNLISLSLGYNRITDEGAEAIANGLRMNRVLLSLSLASNKITDKGAIKFGEVFSRFPLTHAEVVERRKLLREKGSPDRTSGKSPPPSRRADSKDRPGSVRSGSHLDKGDKKRDKSSKRKEGKRDKEETVKGGTKNADKFKKGVKSALLAETVSKVTKGKKTTSSKDKKGAVAESDSSDMIEAINPLLESVEPIEGQLWIPGNRAIINLNLTRNRIGETGMEALLKAIRWQISLSNFSPSPVLKGIMRLSINRNAVKPDNETFKKLVELVTPRDPFYKPEAKSPDGEQQSLAG